MMRMPIGGKEAHGINLAIESLSSSSALIQSTHFNQINLP